MTDRVAICVCDQELCNLGPGIPILSSQESSSKCRLNISDTMSSFGNIVLRRKISIMMLGLGCAPEQARRSITISCIVNKLVINRQLESLHVLILASQLKTLIFVDKMSLSL